jgi:hypothetical protein
MTSVNRRPTAPGIMALAASLSQTTIPLRSRTYIGTGTVWRDP